MCATFLTSIKSANRSMMNWIVYTQHDPFRALDMETRLVPTPILTRYRTYMNDFGHTLYKTIQHMTKPVICSRTSNIQSQNTTKGSHAGLAGIVATLPPQHTPPSSQNNVVSTKAKQPHAQPSFQPTSPLLYFLRHSYSKRSKHTPFSTSRSPRPASATPSPP